MATTIVLKNSVTTTNTPSSLAQGEVAINVTDKKVWVGNAATTPIQIVNGGPDGVFTSVTDSGLTNTRVTYAGAGGLLKDSASITTDGTTLTAAGFSGPVGATTASTGAFTTLTATNFNAASTFDFKNRIINGGMTIDQRFAGASTTPSSGAYLLDRFFYTATQASKMGFQQNYGAVTLPTGFSNYLGMFTSTPVSVGAGDTFLLAQNIEGFNTADLGFGTANAKTVTLSFRIYSSLTGTFGGALSNSGGSRSYPFSYSIPTANTWTTISVTIAGDTSGTWIGSTNGVGLVVRFGLGSGSTFSGTAGAWAAGNYVQPTSTVSVVGTSGATFFITGVQLETGSVATTFDYRDYGRELIMCQRYFQKTFPQTVAIAQNAGTTGAILQQDSGSISYGAQIWWRFPVTMRTTPTVVLYNPSAANANVRNIAATADCTTVGSSIPTSDSQTSIVAVSPTPIAGQTLAIHFSTSAEL